MTKLNQLGMLGQSIWLDHIRRSFIASGELQAWIDRGLKGVTSNPSIFEKAIAGSTDYDDALRELVRQERSAQEIYEALVLEDITRAADLLRPVYDQTEGLDGYVSLEVDPALAHDTANTVAEAERLFRTLDRPNIMIKVPATPEGIPAIESLIAAGININVTLIFSLSQYEALANAYVAGLEKLAAAGGQLNRVASVASFFVSRVDTAVDRALGERDKPALQGKIAVANAKVAYDRARRIFDGDRWDQLAAQGARVQRLLWASTSTKNPRYPDTKYVSELIGPDTVNTVPPKTLDLFLDHGTVASTLCLGTEKARADLVQLAELGIDLDGVTQQLLDDGVASFAKAFKALMDSISTRRKDLLVEWEQLSVALHEYQPAVDAALREMEDKNVVGRIWAHDHTVWKPEPTEITNRLGWLDIAESMIEQIDCLEALAEDVRDGGYTHALLLGMGGSSLAPEVFRKTFGVPPGCLDLAVLDMTDPAALLYHAKRLDPAHTLLIVATKSGGTAETLSFFKFYYNWMVQAVGQENAGAHFIAITDTGSKLAALAQEYDFRATFLNNPNIGGRYSALSYFGLVPAVLLGIDVEMLLNRTLTMSCNCQACNCSAGGNNGGALLGAAMSEIASAGRDKLTLVLSPEIASFGDWVEQLIAESTGKEHRGILPVVGEPLGDPSVYREDRFFVYLRLNGDDTYDASLQALQDAGHPVARLQLRDIYDLGQQFFLWEIATAIAGHRLKINPFDQPNVEAAKILAREMVTVYTETGHLPEAVSAPLAQDQLLSFLNQARPGDYIALHAYVQPTPERARALSILRVRLRDRYRLATTIGYGPRFLHSTGQLHKGDAGNGLFIQLTDDTSTDVPIPDEAGSPTWSISFGVLEEAQVQGDQQALLAANRRVIRFNLGTDVVGNLNNMTEMLA
jgi:transaldolase / glucose-6-phosphate isomerase